ncbi:hypothetical protein ACFCXF_14485 [Streptomyces virginiae]
MGPNRPTERRRACGLEYPAGPHVGASCVAFEAERTWALAHRTTLFAHP